jgi:hypothetical protein
MSINIFCFLILDFIYASIAGIKKGGQFLLFILYIV